MRRILALAILALTLAGGIVTFVASVQAHPNHQNCGGRESDAFEDQFGEVC
jgi:hypothetical protein